MELKSLFLSKGMDINIGSNRTFMELKFSKCHCSDLPRLCSNRTFMELKFLSNLTNKPDTFVLIVPLWN